MTFEQLEDLFYSTNVNASPSAFHGFLCGRLSCGAVPIEILVAASTDWLGLSGEQAEAIQVDLQVFYETALSDLEDYSFLFSPSIKFCFNVLLLYSLPIIDTTTIAKKNLNKAEK